MSSRLLDELGHLSGTNFHAGLDASLVTTLERDQGVALPGEHLALLRESNGIEAYAGYIRLFGVRTTEGIDALEWNRQDCWKFAWGHRCSEYWCFGETAWGDQYAYAIESLPGGRAGQVYLLDAISMTPQVVASSFIEFLEKEFVRSAKDPYDVMIKRARQKFGPLEVTSHLVYVPSVLMGGDEDINSVQRMNARAAMICNGDIAMQIDEGPPDKVAASVQPYEDQARRMRVRLVWD